MASKEKLQNGKVSDIQSLRQNCNYGRMKWSMVRKCIVIYVMFSIQYPLVRGGWLLKSVESEDQTCTRNQDIEKLSKSVLEYKESTDSIIRNLLTRIDEMNTMCTALEEKVKTHDELITVLKKSVNTHDGSIAGLEGRVGTHDGNISGLERRVNTNDESISGLERRVNTNDESISGLEGKVNLHDGSISGLEGRVNTNDESISSLKGRVNTHDESISNLERRVNTNDEIISGLKGRVNTHDGSISGLEGRVGTHDGSLSGLEGRVSTHDGSISGLEGRVSTHDGSLSGLEGRVNTHDGSLSGLEGRVNTHDGSISGFEVRVNTHDESFIDLEGRVNSHDGKINDTLSRLNSHQTMIDQQSNDLKDRISNAKENLIVTEEKIRKMNDQLYAHDKDLMTAFENLFNKEVAMVVLGLILFMNFGLIIAVYSLCQSRPRQLGRPVYAAHNTGPDNTYYNPVLDMIPVGPKLRKSVGVISFTREYQPTHRHLLSSVTEAMDDVKYHVILTDDDIPAIPLCSLIVICIEYSDRDVIIEERGYGLGDCNKTTLAAAEKIGAIPVIIYCKDLSSQRLPHGRLYNPRLRCATHQMELIPLSSDNRFFSVYEDFSVTQQNAFRKLIEDHVRPE